MNPFPNFGGAFGPPQGKAPASQAPPPGPNSQPAGEPCTICGEPTTVGADVDKGDGRGWKRYPICTMDSNPMCVQDLTDRFSGNGPGSQMRMIYPSKSDV